ncbi:hypothetical protein F4819DRAFT_487241 [Hypoxylon fuscum]|nr:hypothetical protein F4819DRAFT_487241 [Hypoxylon fuscum]
MSYTQDKAHSSAVLGAILDGEKAQQQSAAAAAASSDSASIFSTSSFGSAKALLKKHTSSSKSKPKPSKPSSGTSEAELLRTAQRNQSNSTKAIVNGHNQTRKAFSSKSSSGWSIPRDGPTLGAHQHRDHGFDMCRPESRWLVGPL